MEFAKDSYVTERKNYPYRHKAEECRMKGNSTIPTPNQNFNWIHKKFNQITRRGQPHPIEHAFNSQQVYRLRSGSVRALKEALNLGPISVCVNAENSHEWDFYRGGIIDSETCKPEINHAVVAVGYGKTTTFGGSLPAREYVIIKNSWGPNWGDEGYAKISLSRDKHKGGICGVLLFNYGVNVKQVIPDSND